MADSWGTSKKPQMNFFPAEWSLYGKSFSEVSFAPVSRMSISFVLDSWTPFTHCTLFPLFVQNWHCKQSHQDVSIIFGITTVQSFQILHFSPTHQTFAQPLLSIRQWWEPRESRSLCIETSPKSIINWFCVDSLAYKSLVIVRRQKKSRKYYLWKWEKDRARMIFGDWDFSFRILRFGNRRQTRALLCFGILAVAQTMPFLCVLDQGKEEPR